MARWKNVPRPHRHRLQATGKLVFLGVPQQPVELELNKRLAQLARFPVDETGTAVVAKHCVDLPDEAHPVGRFGGQLDLGADEALDRDRAEPLVQRLHLVDERRQHARLAEPGGHLHVERGRADLLAARLVEPVRVDRPLPEVAGRHSVGQPAEKDALVSGPKTRCNRASADAGQRR